MPRAQGSAEPWQPGCLQGDAESRLHSRSALRAKSGGEGRLVVVGRAQDSVSSTERLLRGISSWVHGPPLLVCLGLALALMVSLAPLWGAEGGGGPLALGFASLDGTTEIVEFVDGEPQDGALLQEGPLGAPPEPLAHQLVRLTNVRRVNQGLPPLKAASELMASAQYHSNWMANHNCFAHDCPGEPSWVTRIANAGYVNYTHLAENIAAGYFAANDVVTAWMGSSGHRANMLSPDFRETGGGYAYAAGTKYRRYWTMDFGTRGDAQGNPVFPVVINNEAWFTNNPDVQLYVYGQGWASQMRFRNAGGTWSAWQPYQSNTAWTLSGDNGSPAVVYAQLRQGSSVVESSDSIHINLPPQVSPDYLMFFSVQGTEPTMPIEYALDLDASGNWSASANRSWIRLSQYSGSGDATVEASVDDFPTSAGTYAGTITFVAFGLPTEMDVTLVVTNGPLQQNHVPVSSKGQGS